MLEALLRERDPQRPMVTKRPIAAAARMRGFRISRPARLRAATSAPTSGAPNANDAVVAAACWQG